MLDERPDIQCLACDIVAGRQAAPGGVIHEDDHWMLDHAVDPLIRGCLILKSKRHVDELADLEPDEAATLGPMMRTALAAMRRAFDPERIYVCSFGEMLHHLHIHLLPRYRSLKIAGRRSGPSAGMDLAMDLHPLTRPRMLRNAS